MKEECREKAVDILSAENRGRLQVKIDLKEYVSLAELKHFSTHVCPFESFQR